MEEAAGRSWAVLKGDKLHGLTGFHEGDTSDFVAEKA
jgi:hypothetical protein